MTTASTTAERRVARPPVIGREAASNRSIRYPADDAPHYLPDRNALILGRARSGKTAMAGHRITKERHLGTRIAVIDTDGSLSSVIDALGGRILRPGEPGQSLNPLYLVIPAGSSNEAVCQATLPRLKLLDHVIETMSGKRTARRGKRTARRLSLLTGQTLANFYGNHNKWGATEQGTGGLAHFRQYLKEPSTHEEMAQPPFAPAPSVKAAAEKCNSMADGIGRFLESPAGTLVRDNTDLDAETLTAVDLSRLPEDQKGLGMALAIVLAATAPRSTDTSPSRLRHPDCRRLLLIDECRPLTAHPGLRWMLPGLMKQARRCGLAVMATSRHAGRLSSTTTQEGQAAATDIHYTSTMILLRQSPRDHAKVATLPDNCWILPHPKDGNKENLLPALEALTPRSALHLNRTGEMNRLDLREGR